MAEIHWLTSVNGNFTNRAHWSGGVVPGPADDAILDAVGGSFTVTSSSDEKVNSIQLSSNAVLDVARGVFAASAGTGSGVNAGAITVSGAGALSVGGMVDNEGSVVLAYERGVGDGSIVISKNVTLAGGGTITGDGIVSAAKSGLTVVNVDNSVLVNVEGFNLVNKKNGILGAFEIGEEQDVLSIVNNGTVTPVNEFDRMYIGNCNISGSGIISVPEGAFVQFDNGGTMSGQGILIAAGGAMGLGADAVDYAGVLENSGTLGIGTGKMEPAFYLQGATTFSGRGEVELSGAIGGDEDTLINVDNTIEGAGNIGLGEISIVNQGAGVIEAAFSSGLVLDCDTLTLVNDGEIAALGKSNLAVTGPIDNSGKIVGRTKSNITLSGDVVNDGVISVGRGALLVADGPVSGTGFVTLAGGTLDFNSAFSQSVEFNFFPDSVLELGQSQSYSGTVSGFGLRMDALDLIDIGFSGAGEATYSGTSKRGILTVTDGVHTASIEMKGDYLNTTFVASSDGHGGVKVVAESNNTTSMPLHAFISAMAGFSAQGGQTVHASMAGPPREFLLTSPRVAIA